VSAARSNSLALKTYGMIVADNGGNWFLSGAPNANWDDTDINNLKQIHGSDFEAVDTSSLQPPTDATLPTGPSNLVLTAIGSTQINAAWTAATDNVGVIGYRVTASLNPDFLSPLSAYTGAYVGNAANATLTQLSPATKYYVRVVAYDEAGNASTGVTGNATAIAAKKRVGQLVGD
jgi:fibronectin type III domain protein